MCTGRRKNDVVCSWAVGRPDGKGEDRLRYVGSPSIWIDLYVSIRVFHHADTVPGLGSTLPQLSLAGLMLRSSRRYQGEAEPW